MSDVWKPEPRPLPENGPVWPGDDERVSYKGLTVQPEPDLEWWEPCYDRWEVGLAATDGLLFTVHGKREEALSIAGRLAGAKDWTAITETPSWVDIAFDPLILRLMADYPGMIGLPVVEDDGIDDIVPYGPDDQAPDDMIW